MSQVVKTSGCLQMLEISLFPSHAPLHWEGHASAPPSTLQTADVDCEGGLQTISPTSQ